MKAKYVSVVPSTKVYRYGSAIKGEHIGQQLQHSTTVDITPRHVVAQSEAARKERIEKMFNSMKAVESVPVATRGRGGVDVTQTEDYKGLSNMPVTDRESTTGWFCIDAGSHDKAKKLQAKVNVYARAGAGTFRTRLLKGSNELYVKRISETYTPQRGAGSDE